jgi:membrane-associated protease RseP (regulator of RpoE activity)
MDPFPAESIPVTSPSAPPPSRASRLFGKRRLWLNALLFVLTIASTFFVGLGWSASYRYADLLSRNPNLTLSKTEWLDPHVLILSLIYAIVLLMILSAHELGHYLTCRRYGIDATLPYFIPAPTLVGTMGAFIRIKTPITRKHQLFDIGAAGPLAGFALAVPALVVGLALSKVVPALPREGTLLFGEPLLLKILGGVLLRNVGPGTDVILHPAAFAGWVGMLVTAMNLFPIGQLDGGHVAYAVFGPRSKLLGRIFLVAFIVLGIVFWAGWLIWAVLILIIGVKHPRTWDESSALGTRRTVMAVLLFVIFILSFIPDPVQGYNIFDLIKQF